MLMFVIFFLTALALSSAVVVAGMFFSKKGTSDQEKLSPFECGFVPKYSARLPFSMRFFLLSLIFLVFDIELVLIFPYTMNIMKSNSLVSMMLVILFLLVLLVGTFHEWNQGMLDWSI